jgi:hypothetical protein
MSILEKGENENERSQQKVPKKVYFKDLVVFGSKLKFHCTIYLCFEVIAKISNNAFKLDKYLIFRPSI